MRAGHRAALPVDPPSEAAGGEGPPTDETYDPGAHTVAEVVAYAAEHPDEVDAIYGAELAGKGRTTLLAALEAPPL